MIFEYRALISIAGAITAVLTAALLGEVPVLRREPKSTERVRACVRGVACMQAAPLSRFSILFRRYDIKIARGAGQTFPWVQQWDRDEGANTTCFADAIAEVHSQHEQHVYWTIETQ